MRRQPLRHIHGLLHDDIERDHEAENDRKKVDRQRRDVGRGHPFDQANHVIRL